MHPHEKEMWATGADCSTARLQDLLPRPQRKKHPDGAPQEHPSPLLNHDPFAGLPQPSPPSLTHHRCSSCRKRPQMTLNIALSPMAFPLFAHRTMPFFEHLQHCPGNWLICHVADLLHKVIQGFMQLGRLAQDH
jgi:hypothetical protein